jgi:hypothetical protein
VMLFSLLPSLFSLNSSSLFSPPHSPLVSFPNAAVWVMCARDSDHQAQAAAWPWKDDQDHPRALGNASLSPRHSGWTPDCPSSTS